MDPCVCWFCWIENNEVVKCHCLAWNESIFQVEGSPSTGGSYIFQVPQTTTSLQYAKGAKSKSQTRLQSNSYGATLLDLYTCGDSVCVADSVYFCHCLEKHAPAVRARDIHVPTRDQTWPEFYLNNPTHRLTRTIQYQSERAQPKLSSPIL